MYEKCNYIMILSFLCYFFGKMERYFLLDFSFYEKTTIER